MATKKLDERIESLDEKIKQLSAQKKTLEARAKEKERKERTRRLIQIGAIVDSMGINSVDLAEDFKKYFMENEKSKEWLDRFVKDHGDESSQN